MKHLILPLFIGILLFTACSKEKIEIAKNTCIEQKTNPSGRSYTPDLMVATSYTTRHCGLMPLSRNSYWVYADSIFDAGNFTKLQYDTLRFEQTYQSLPDSIIWWKTNIEIGLPELMYANDSALFVAEYRIFAQDPILDAKKEYGLFEGDSMKYYTSFEDVGAIGRSVKLDGVIKTPAGNFDDCILFEKRSPRYRTDQVFFKPGIGVVRYVSEQAPMGSPELKLKKISTLVSFYLD